MFDRVFRGRREREVRQTHKRLLVTVRSCVQRLNKRINPLVAFVHLS